MNANYVLATWDNSREEIIDLLPEDFDRAGELSDSIADEDRQWKTYLNSLACLVFSKWINDRQLDFSVTLIWKQNCEIGYFQIGKLNLGIIAFESALNGGVAIPAAAIDAAHFYVAVEILEERQQAILRGFCRHDRLIADRQSQNLQPDVQSNYLIPFSQWETQFDRLLLNLQFLAPSAIPLPNSDPSILPRVRLSQWFDNLVETGWQAIETVLGTEEVAWSFRNVSSVDREAGVRRAKLLDLGMEVGDRHLALLVAITPENDERIGIRIQLHPGETWQYLPANLSLTMLAETGEIVQEVRSRSRDTYIQLRYFKTLPGTQFGVRVTLNDRSLTETFLV